MIQIDVAGSGCLIGGIVISLFLPIFKLASIVGG